MSTEDQAQATSGLPPGSYSAHGYQPPESSGAQGNAIAALLVSILSIFVCANLFGIAGAILSGLALGRINTDLESARTLTKWSWIVVAAGFVLIVLLMIVAVVLIAVLVPAGLESLEITRPARVSPD